MWQRIKNYYHLTEAFIANIVFRFPSRNLIVIGVTGTEGKTTTTHMIYKILHSTDKKVSMLSTLHAIVADSIYETGLHVTTPRPLVLQKLLRKAVDGGSSYFVLEVTSHALDQNRVAFVKFDIAVLTTLSHDHLDYHKTFENYVKTKFKLLAFACTAVVVPQENLPRAMISLLRKVKLKIVSYGKKNGNYTQSQWRLKLKVPGEFNVHNALAATAVASELGIAKAIIRDALENFQSIPGRMEEVYESKGFRIFIDFAHKPHALEEAIKTAKTLLKKGRVIVMFGCPSERDVMKRPMMGEISARLADITVLTDDDPRFEDPQTIINEIAEGCVRAGAQEYQISKKHIFYKIPNRKMAIEFIIKELAQKGDIILLCGKGHEKSMSIKGVEYTWSEHDAVAQALRT